MDWIPDVREGVAMIVQLFNLFFEPRGTFAGMSTNGWCS